MGLPRSRATATSMCPPRPRPPRSSASAPRTRPADPGPPQALRTPLEPPSRRDSTGASTQARPPPPDSPGPDSRGPEAAGEAPVARGAQDAGNGLVALPAPATSPRRPRRRARNLMCRASRTRSPMMTSRPRPGPGPAAHRVATPCPRQKRAGAAKSRPPASRRPRTARAWTPWPLIWGGLGRGEAAPDRRRIAAHLGRHAGKTDIRSVNLSGGCPSRYRQPTLEPGLCSR